MQDPVITIINFLQSDWSISPVPRIGSSWYNSTLPLPQISVTGVLKNEDILSIGDSLHRLRYTIQIDIWSSAKGERYSLNQETRRILSKNRKCPGDMVWIRPVDEDWLHETEPVEVFRNSITVECHWFEEMCKC